MEYMGQHLSWERKTYCDNSELLRFRVRIIFPEMIHKNLGSSSPLWVWGQNALQMQEQCTVQQLLE